MTDRAATIADYRALGQAHASELMEEIRKRARQGNPPSRETLVTTIKVEGVRLASLGSTRDEVEAWVTALTETFVSLCDTYRKELDRTAARIRLGVACSGRA